MRLVRHFIYEDNSGQLDFYCFNSKNLYNQALYIQKQHWKETGKIYSYPELDKIMKKEKNLEGVINYRLLPKAQVSQQILKLLDKNFKSFFKSIKDWKKSPEKYKGKPNPPKFLRKNGRYLLIFSNQSAKIKNKEIILTKQLKIKIPDNVYLDELQNFNQIRILPIKNSKNKYKIEIIYEKECLNKELNYDEYASIDLGVNNLVTLIDSKGNKPLIISGGIPKSINQFYNKRIARLQSIKDKMKIRHYTKQIEKITLKRNNKINDYFHKISKLVVNYLVQQQIGNLIIGYNKNWKQEINIGKQNNQNFTQIPFLKLIEMIDYKCKIVGINLILQEESYTSKADALVLDDIPSYQKDSDKTSKQERVFSGKRIKRGLYQSSIGKLINADVNSALNILRKVVSDSLFERIRDRGFWFNPVKIRNLFDMSSNSLQNIYRFNNV